MGFKNIFLEKTTSNAVILMKMGHFILNRVIFQRFEFEHRDLHWGNVLIVETDTKLVEFTQNGKNYILKSHGLLATIIDFTFSRLETGRLHSIDVYPYLESSTEPHL